MTVHTTSIRRFRRPVLRYPVMVCALLLALPWPAWATSVDGTGPGLLPWVLVITGAAVVAACLIRAGKAHAQAMDLPPAVTSPSAYISEEYYQQMFVCHPAVHLLIDPQTGVLIDANPAAVRFCGYPLDQLHSLSLFDMSPMSHEVLASHLAKALAGEQSAFEYPHRLASGEIRPVQIVSGTLSSNGRPLLLCMITDITSLRLPEEADHTNLAFIHDVFNISPNMIYLFNDVEKRFVFCNRAFSSFLGYTSAQISAMDTDRLAAILHPSDYEALKEIHRRQRHAPKGTWFDYELSAYHVDGTWHYLQVREVVFSQSDNGTLHEILGIATDITTHKAAEEALIRSEAQFRSIFESSPLGILLIRLDTFEVVAANEAFCSIITRNQQELVGMHLRDITFSEDYAEESERIQSMLQASGKCFEIRKRYIRPDGTVRWADVRGCLLDPVMGKVPLSLGIIEDITDQMVSERERIELLNQLHHAQKLESLRILAGGVAHHFNNLLHAILGLADLAIYEMPPETPGRENLFEISAVARRASELSLQMLSCSGRRAVHLEKTSLNRIIQGARELFEEALNPGQNLFVNLFEPLPSVNVDGAAVRQILTSLITNAAESLPESPRGDGGPNKIFIRTGVDHYDESSLRACVVDEALPAGQYVYVEVADNGCGMDEETLSKVFDPFFTTKFTGRGLGLPTVLGMTRAHHGCIQIESNPGQGTRIRVYFPASKEAVPTRHVDEEAVTESKGTVLVVDDDASIRVVAQRILQTNGYRAVLKKNGQEAVEYCEEHPEAISCVLLDLIMPVMNGFRAYTLIRQVAPTLPVIIATGYHQDDWDETIEDPPPEGILYKPYDAEDLLALLDAVIPHP